jgi:hypothetical protein
MDQILRQVKQARFELAIAHVRAAADEDNERDAEMHRQAFMRYLREYCQPMKAN